MGNGRTKGRQFEFWCREVITLALHLPDGDVNVRSKSAPGCDLWIRNGSTLKFPYCVEVKNRKRLNVFEAFRQAQVNTYDGYLPALFSHRDRLYLATEDLYEFLAKIDILNETLGLEWIDKVRERADNIRRRAPKISDARLEPERSKPRRGRDGTRKKNETCRRRNGGSR